MLKYRGWNSKTSEMVTPLIEWNNGLFSITKGVGSCDHVMQFTGLQDKNGVEIYEGDIVFQIRKDGCFYGDNVKETVLIGPSIYKELTAKASGGPDGDYPIIEMEIIGNIHQNPELLENNNG